MATDISCVMPRPDINTLHDQFTTELSARLLGGAPVLPMSAEDIIAFVMAGATNLAWSYVNQALRESDPATMCCDNLVAYGVRHGFNLRAATRAKGYVIATGDAGASIPSGIRFIGSNGTEYKLDPAITTNPSTLDSSGRAALRVVSAGAAVAYNVAAGIVLTVGTTTSGIDPTVTVGSGGIGGGTDAETCEELRTRLVAAESRGVTSTNANWYINQAESYPGVVRVCADNCYGCCDPNTIALYPFFGADVYPPYGVPPGSVLDEMNEWMFGTRAGMGEGLAPIGVNGGFRCALPTIMDVEIYCYQGCDPANLENITTALNAFLGRYCVGDTICKQHIQAVIAAAAPNICYSEAALNLDCTQAGTDNANIYLDCGHFLALGEVTLNTDCNPYMQLEVATA